MTKDVMVVVARRAAAGLLMVCAAVFVASCVAHALGSPGWWAASLAAGAGAVACSSIGHLLTPHPGLPAAAQAAAEETTGEPA